MQQHIKIFGVIFFATLTAHAMEKGNAGTILSTLKKMNEGSSITCLPKMQHMIANYNERIFILSIRKPMNVDPKLLQEIKPITLPASVYTIAALLEKP